MHHGLHHVLGVALAIGVAVSTSAATLYRPGDIADDFSLVDRATGQPSRLSDFSGKIVVLDWFAWWCPFCQAAAPQLYSGIDQHYTAANGNPDGIPVVHVGVNLQSGQESQTQNFINQAGFDVVLQDFSRTVASRFASTGQPIFGIINCVTNSPSHAPYEVLYVQSGYGQTTFSIDAFRAAIDSVKAAPPTVRLSSPVLGDGGTVTLTFETEPGQAGVLEASTNLMNWAVATPFSATSGPVSLTLTNSGNPPARFFRVVPPP